MKLLERIAWGVVIVLLAFWLIRANQARSREVQKAADLAAQVLADSTRYRAEITRLSLRGDSLARSLASWSHTATVLRGENTALRGRIGALLASGDTAGAQASQDTLIRGLEEEVNVLGRSLGTCQGLVKVRETQLQGCSLRVDTLQQALTRLTTATQRQTRFSLGLFSLPVPPKWLAGALGCTVGGLLDAKDRLRGCGLGAAGSLLVVPTR